MMDKRTEEKDVILKELTAWSNRKRSMISNERYIDISLNHLKQATSLAKDRKSLKPIHP
jgi:hypothetical protein